MKINVSVTLPSGAKIEVTPAQSRRIHSILFGHIELPKEGRAGKKKVVMGARRWQEGEIEEVRALKDLDRRARGKATLALARKMGRTPGAVAQKLWELRQIPERT